MSSIEEDDNSRFKLAQLWHLVQNTKQLTPKTHVHNRVVSEILRNNFNNNYKVSVNIDLIGGPTILMKDCTALHFAYYDVRDINTFNALLERGADFTIKNGNGQTVIHLIMTKYRSRYRYYNRETDIPFINSVLSAHMKFQNFTNPRDNYGFSHFHSACLINNVKVVKLFLENGALIDEAVNFEAPTFAGYTALHFAAEFNSFEVIQILIDHGANVNALTAKGISPLDFLIVNKPSHISQSEQAKEQLLKKDEDCTVDLSSKNERMTQVLLGRGAISAVGFSNLHIACTFKDVTIAEDILYKGADIDNAVPTKSLLRPGDTALHFAAHNSIEVMKMLLRRGAKLDIANTEGKTFLDICMNTYSLLELCNILLCNESCKGTCLSVGQTKLLDVIVTMETGDQFKFFLDNETVGTSVVVPNDSILWPGYSLLHFAVIFGKNTEYNYQEMERTFEKTIVEECLNRKLSVNIQNVEGQSPVHLAFIQEKWDIAKLLLKQLDNLERVANLVDKNNLSYLHIACYMKSESLVEKLLRFSDLTDVCRATMISLSSIGAGSTPLHVVAANGSHGIAGLLLRRGANLHAVDKNGLSPIHCLLHFSWHHEQQISDVLLNSLLVHPEDRVVDGLGLSYLHVACLFGHVPLVKKLLELGSNVNAIIKYDENLEVPMSNSIPEELRCYSNFTPLQMAIKNLHSTEEVFNLLLHRGANMFVRGSKDYTKLWRCTPFENGKVVRCFFQLLWDKEDIQKSMMKRLGLTKLHIACYLKNGEAIKSALTDGVNVDVPIRADSIIFAGFTPLHLLMTITDVESSFQRYNLQFSIADIINLLLDHGADVTKVNAEKDTPIHVFYKHQIGFIDREICKILLLNAHLDFSNNPMNDEGLSHFHLACHWHQVEVAQRFLQHGCSDINKPIDYFARNFAGCAPLHLTLCHDVIEPNTDLKKLWLTVEVLLKHGANVGAKDVYGDTPLHKAATSSAQLNLLEMLVSWGGDIKSHNLRGQTAIEKMMDISTMNANLSNNLMIFQKYGYTINRWNPLTGEGYIAKIFLQSEERLSNSYEFEKFIETLDARTVDDLGRSAIHNSVALSEVEYSSGKIRNYTHAIESFIGIGIDIDYQDNAGQTALHYATRMENVAGIEVLLAYGADINILDNSGKSAFSYAIEHSENKNDLFFCIEKNATIAFRLHVQKLQHLRTEVSQLNQNLMKKVQRIFNNRDHILSLGGYNLSQNFFREIEMTKTVDLGTKSLTLFNFLSETGAVTLYCLLPEHKREVIDNYLKSIDFENFKELSGIIKLQLKKVTARLELIDLALGSLRTLLGFSVPDVCEQISRFLSNSDLKNLHQSTLFGTRKRKISEISS